MYMIYGLKVRNTETLHQQIHNAEEALAEDEALRQVSAK
jgi:hypothetical protein